MDSKATTQAGSTEGHVPDTATLHSDKEKQEVQVIEKIAPNSQPDFPEGGLRAWLTVLGAFLIQICTFGYISSFGAYQGYSETTYQSRSLLAANGSTDYYVRVYLSGYSSSEIGWIGSVQILLIMSMGIFTGRAFDRGYFHYLTIGGSVLFGLALFLLSVSQQDRYYQVFLTQGLLGGIACGIMYIPSLAIVSHYFHKRRALAMGIVAAGSSSGAVVHPIMLNRLFNGSVGFHNGVRASAGLNLGLLLVANLLMKPRLPPKKGGSAIPIKEFIRDPPYVLAVLSGSFVMMAIFFPIFFLQLNVIKHGMDKTFAFYSISILNGASVFGRILPGFFVSYTGVFNQMIINTLGIIVLMFCFVLVKTVPGVVCFAIFFGFFSGAAVTLMPPLLSTLARDFSEIGARMGLCFTVMGFAGLIGAPIAGALVTSEYIWWRAIVFAGALLVIGEALMIAARSFVVRRKGTKKV